MFARAVNELYGLSAITDLRELRGKPIAGLAGRFTPRFLEELATELREVADVLVEAAKVAASKGERVDN